jgi:hypothetical protein
MATTTNYGWTTPDNTALVKDGAAAIRTLGSSADTTVKALNPGTTAGDIDYYTTSTAKARVGIGTAGQVLAVNSGATAPEWVTSSSGGMTLLSTTTLTGNNVTISSISQDYQSLHILITGVTNATADGALRVRPDGSTNNGSTGQVLGTDYNQFSNISLSFEQNMLRTSANNAFALDIFNYASTTTYKPFTFSGFYESSGPTNQYVIGGGGTSEISAIDSLFIFHGGGALSTGTVRIYGVK